MTESAAPPEELVVATGNPGKLAEIAAIFEPYRWQVRPQADWGVSAPTEDGETFVENALTKARHAARRTRKAALGDDSGLVVAALDGRPGVHSSRFAGAGAADEDNNRKLLAELEGVPPGERNACFYCAMVLMRHGTDPAPLIATGRWEGEILETPRGSGGFGYDPLFWVPEQRCSAAELPPAAKNRLSHRGQALARLIELLIREQPDGT